MMITIQITKSDVMDEVARTAAYMGARKSEGSDGSYDRVSITDGDREMLERYWNEANGLLAGLFKRFMECEQPTSDNGDHIYKLCMSSRYNDNLTSEIRANSNSFVVNYLVGHWCEQIGKGDWKNYIDNATSLLEDVKGKLFYKRKPTRIPTEVFDE